LQIIRERKNFRESKRVAKESGREIRENLRERETQTQIDWKTE